MSLELIIILAFLLIFPLFFGAVWFLVISILGAASGWKGLERRFPDRDEPAVETFRGASGILGGAVRMNNVLTLTACPSGLRVSVNRMFGPSRRPLFVPWREIAVERRSLAFEDVAVLSFGAPAAGKLQIAAKLADRLAAASSGRWPERIERQAPPIVS